MSATVTLQNNSTTKNIPAKKLFTNWVTTAIANNKNYEIVIRIVDKQEITNLNKKYRKKNQPTNIIVFKFSPPPTITTNLLGDIVICASTVKLEAKAQHKTIISHWAHLTIHGTLHLLNYNHKNKKTAQKMETLEIKTLQALGFANPYN